MYGPGVNSSSDPLQASGMGGDPLQGPGDPGATTTPWISFSPGTSLAVLPGSHSSGSTGTWQTGNSGQSGTSAATFGMPPGFLDSGFTGHGGPSTGIHHCHSSRPSDGTDAAPTDVANPRGYGSSIQDRSWTSTTTNGADTNSSAELYRRG